VNRDTRVINANTIFSNGTLAIHPSDPGSGNRLKLQLNTTPPISGLLIKLKVNNIMRISY